MLGETSRQLGIGTLVLVDELQEATGDELTAINTAVHQLGQHDAPLPVMFVGAGLPSLPAQLAEATSYAERLYEDRPIGLLDEQASRSALTDPVTSHGVTWDESALDAALVVAAGYPYFLQAVGKHVWDIAAGTKISLEDAEMGSAAAHREVDDGLYRARWERATPAQRDLLRAMADLTGDQPSPVADLTAAMGKKRVSDLSVSRNELIKKGLLYAPERGLLAFTVPGMHTFVTQQP